MTTLVEAHEPEDGFFDGAADGQEAVVLEESGFGAAEGAGDVFAFLFREHDAVEGGVEDVVVVEGAGVLGDGVEFSA